MNEKDYYLNSLSSSRLRHSIKCAEFLESISKIAGLNPKIAYFTGLYHDIFRELSGEDFEKIYSRYSNFIPEEWKKYGLRLFHGPLCALYLKDSENISDKIFNAIFFHTTGNINMSNLLQALLIADFCEPTRKHKNSVKIRNMILSKNMNEKKISEIAFMVIEYKIMYLNKKNDNIFQKTIDARNYLKKKIWKEKIE